MLQQHMLKPLRKLFILLALLTVCLGFLSPFTVKKAHALPCCSACDFNPRICLHGCSPSC